MSAQRLAIGLTSGAAMEGIDVAAIETDGRTVSEFGPTLLRPWDDRERAAIRTARAAAPAIANRAERPAPLETAEKLVTAAHVDAVATFLAANGLRGDDVAVIGVDGETVLHAPDRRLSVQLGDGLALARAVGVPVVHDLRGHDVAAGGRGAPLAPVYLAALVASADLPRPAVVLDLDAVAGLTWIGRTVDDADGTGLLAFDCGPGIAPLVAWLTSAAGRPVDLDGRLAAVGRVDEALVAECLADPYLALPPPKALDRDFVALDRLAGLGLADGAATLTAIVADTVARGLALVPETPATLVVAGIGAHDPTLVTMIAARTGAAVVTAADIGWSTDFLAAQAVAHLAVRHLEHLALTFPTTTGVAHPMRGGVKAVP